MLELNGLPTEAKIGKILILISINLSVIGIAIIVTVSLFLNAIAATPHFILLSSRSWRS